MTPRRRANAFRYRNPTAARLVDSIAATLDPAEQDALYRSLVPIFQADLPVTYLYPGVRSSTPTAGSEV